MVEETRVKDVAVGGNVFAWYLASVMFTKPSTGTDYYLY